MRRNLALWATASAALMGPLAAPAAASTNLLGDQAVEATVDTNASGQAQAWPFIASASGPAANLSVYTSAGGSLKVGLYASAQQKPGKLLASGSTGTLAAGWNQVSLSPGGQVARGVRYWVATLGTGVFRDRVQAACGSQGSAQTTLSSLPSTWTAGPQWGSCPASIYISSGPPPPPAAPMNTAPPTINGQAAQGSLLNATTGSWANSPTNYAYIWQGCTTSTNCANISGATSSSYALSSGDVGHTMRVVLIATNPVGSSFAVSAQSPVITGPAPPTKPANTALPTISGTPQQGQTLTASPGTWTGNAPISYTYLWSDGTTGQSDTLPASDVGKMISVSATGTNPAGSSSTTSQSVGPVTASGGGGGVGGGGGGVTFQPIDGGASYFAHISPNSAWMDSHVLLGAWLEQPLTATEVGYDAATGNNIYWNLAGSPNNPSNPRADYNVIRAGGMHASAPDTTSNTGSETVAMDGNDESDMNFGPGWNGYKNNGVWNNSACIPSGSACGYTVDSQYYKSISGRYAVHQGDGKGVLFWQTDPQASQFTAFSDILSADSYWLTDPDLQVPSQGGCALLPNNPAACSGGNGSGLTYAQAHLAANYAYDVTELQRLQALNGASKPVVVDVETGCPFGTGGSGNGHCIKPPEMVAAAWHSLIAGARGIIWFQHNFSGPCIDLRSIIDGSNPSSGMYNCQQTPGVTLHNMVSAMTTFSQEIKSLNNVLLAPTALGYLTTTADVSTLTKAYNGSCYIFAGSGRVATPPPTNQTATFNLADPYTGPVTVIDENRTIQAANGTFQDTFADANTTHVYQLSSASC